MTGARGPGKEGGDQLQIRARSRRPSARDENVLLHRGILPIPLREGRGSRERTDPQRTRLA